MTKTSQPASIDWHARPFGSLTPEQEAKLAKIRQKAFLRYYEQNAIIHRGFPPEYDFLNPAFKPSETHFILMAGDVPFGSLSAFKDHNGRMEFTSLYMDDDLHLRRDFTKRFGEGHHSPTTELVAQAITAFAHRPGAQSRKGSYNTTELFKPGENAFKRLAKRIPGFKVKIHEYPYGNQASGNYAKALARLKPKLEFRA